MNLKTLAVLTLAAVPAVAFADQDVPAEIEAKADQADKVAFVGVGLSQASPELAGHLKLGEGVGLVVSQVADGSPAAGAGLANGDVLVKLGDQLLVNPEQFATLVRLREPGTEATLTVVQAGEQKDVTLTLGETDRPATPMRLRVFAPGLDGQIEGIRGVGGGRHFLLPNVEVERLRAQLAEAEQGVERARLGLMENREALRLNLDELREQAERFRGMNFMEFDDHNFDGVVDPAARDFNMRMNVVSREDGVVARYTLAGDEVRFRYEADGEVLFDGPATTDEQRAAMPEAAREKLEAMEKNVNVAPKTPRLPQAPETPQKQSL